MLYAIIYASVCALYINTKYVEIADTLNIPITHGTQ